MADARPSRRPQLKAKRGSSAASCRVFAYGTLLEPGRQKKLFGRRVRSVAATLVGWSKSRCVGRYHGIIRCRGAVTVGGVLKLSRAELKKADGWERVPTLYIRRRLGAQVGDSKALVRCWTYVPAFEASKAIRSKATQSLENGTRGKPNHRSSNARSPIG